MILLKSGSAEYMFRQGTSGLSHKISKKGIGCFFQFRVLKIFVSLQWDSFVIDIPRSTYAPGVFDGADSKDPKIKSSVMAMINKQIKEFEKEYINKL